jgi:hypothetical protein
MAPTLPSFKPKEVLKALQMAAFISTIKPEDTLF